jgi:ATP-dependent DNA helicase RecQ
VFGIVDGEEVALVKPVARALLLRDALRPTSMAGSNSGPARARS